MGPTTEEGSNAGLNWLVTRQHGLVTVALSGEFDLATSETLSEAAASLLAEGSTLVFDLGDLEFMDSTGLRFLGRLKKEADAEGSRFLLSRISQPVRRILHVAGLLDYFDYIEGLPPDERLCRTCDSWVPASASQCVHCGASL